MACSPQLRLHLVLLQAVFLHHLIPLLLESDDDQGHENIDEEKREDDEVDHIEDGHLHTIAGAGALVLIRGVHGVLEDSARGQEKGRETKSSSEEESVQAQ